MAALDTPIVIADAAVYYNIDDTNPAANLTNSFNDNIILGKKEVEQLNCKLFNETLSTKPREMNGGFYDFVLSNNLVVVFIGDFNNHLDGSQEIPQGSVHSNIGAQVITNNLTTLSYTET